MINFQTDRGRRSVSGAAESVRLRENVVEIGRLLTEVKDEIGHGNWLPWLESDVGFHQTTADRFMRAYDMVMVLSGIPIGTCPYACTRFHCSHA
jgi:hypothetical protein